MKKEADPENGTMIDAVDLDALRIADLEISKAESSATINDLRWQMACRDREGQKRADISAIEEARKMRDRIAQGVESKYEMGLSLSTE